MRSSSEKKLIILIIIVILVVLAISGFILYAFWGMVMTHCKMT